MRTYGPGFVAIVGAFALLVGCDGVFVDQALYPQRYSNGDFEYAARNGEMRTEVVGDPFGNTPGIATTVAEHMYRANRGPIVKFVLAPEGGGSAPFHVVMVFNPPPRVSGADACAQANGIETARGTEPIRLLAAFCSGDVVMSEAGGRVGGAAGPADPKFRSLIRQVTLALIPPADRRRTPF
jgi:hypothetical protein